MKLFHSGIPKEQVRCGSDTSSYLLIRPIMQEAPLFTAGVYYYDFFLLGNRKTLQWP
uniref:Uncharacterized protein n=1 Tax=Lepeophtheirus salmonis TaxID=72036 RepID=A0A0K2TT44_LEPSM